MKDFVTEESKIYFMGIGGTGMASVAGLMQQAGYEVSGSDANIYPPMSTMLEELGIQVLTPYDPENLKIAKPEVVVVANVLSPGHPELEAALKLKLPLTSFPALLSEKVLSKKYPVVVSGTHGKTTTSSLIAHTLNHLGQSPGYMIGGIPQTLPRSFELGQGPLFVIEGDEYDTAYFDKGPKFLHYSPYHLVLNNLEFDHADIYENLEAIMEQFSKLVQLPPAAAHIVANIDDENLCQILDKAGLKNQVLTVSPGGNTEADVMVESFKPGVDRTGVPLWHAHVQSSMFGKLIIETSLSGEHNIANIAQTIGTLQSACIAGHFSGKLDKARITEAVRSFKGVKRRLELLGTKNNISIFEDFAHHPTAVASLIQGLRSSFPDRRLVAAFEPRNASSRRNIFTQGFAKSLQLADRVLIGECPQDLRIPENERMNTSSLQLEIGTKATAFASNEELFINLAAEASPGDIVVFMSCGSFSGIQHRLVAALEA